MKDHIIELRRTIWIYDWSSQLPTQLKVAEHSFQEPIPNSPLLLSYLSFAPVFCKSQD